MAGLNYENIKAITDKRTKERDWRISKLSGQDKALAEEVAACTQGEKIQAVAKEFYAGRHQAPSLWFEKRGLLGSRVHKGLLDAFVPKAYQASYLYIIDRLNQFPFSRGWQRRTVRTADYGPQIGLVFSLLYTYEKLFFVGERLEDLIYWRLPAEKLDYIKSEWGFGRDFSLIYAAEIDRGNQAVIGALKDLILSENNTAYLDREMILGILRSDNRELHKLIGDLLLAARLQEGLRQTICEAMDEGTREAFFTILQVIEENDLIRYSSVKRAVSTWIGIFDENSVDRVNGKLLGLMGRCLRDRSFCREQLKTEDSVAISVGLWALGFEEVKDAVEAMGFLIDNGTKNQKLTASFYNHNLYDENLKIQTARKVLLEHTQDLELVAAFLPAYTVRLHGFVRSLLYGREGGGYAGSRLAAPKKPFLRDYFENREDALRQYESFWAVYERLPKKGVVFDPCIFPWYRVELSVSSVISLLAFTAYVLQDEEKITQMAPLLGEVTEGRQNLVNLLLYHPANQVQRGALLDYMGNAEEATAFRAMEMVERLTFGETDFRQMEDMLRFKRSKLRAKLLAFLMKQDDKGMEECLERLLEDKREEKRNAGLDLLLRLSKEEDRAALYGRVKHLAAKIESPTDREKVLLEEILSKGQTNTSQEKGFGLYDPDAPEEIPGWEVCLDDVFKCVPLSEEEIIAKIKKLDDLFREYKDYEYETPSGERELVGNLLGMRKREESGEKQRYGRDHYLLENYPLGEKLRAYYEEEIGDYGTFVEWEARQLLRNEEVYQKGRKFYEAVPGKPPFAPLPFSVEFGKQIDQARIVFRYEFLDKKLLFRAGVQAARALTRVVNKHNQFISYSYTGWGGRVQTQYTSAKNLCLISRFLEGLGYWETDGEFTEAFYAAWGLELARCDREKEAGWFLPETRSYSSLDVQAMTPITPYWFLKAFHLGLISRDSLYKAMLNYFSRSTCLRALTLLKKGEYEKPGNRSAWSNFFGGGMAQEILDRGEELVGKDTWCGQLIGELYDAIVPMMVDTELRRGEAPTRFSPDMGSVRYITGIPYLIRILMALGKDKLGREAYYSWYYRHSSDKREVLSHLLKVCFPEPGENGKALGEALKGTDIKAERLVEVAMYAPQWMDIIQEYLGWEGLKSGCYYFMAHMNERFDDAKMAMIAKYTPLSAEELQEGAFDIDWFREAYGALGEKNFGLLYKAAKYISNGQKHSRARKYADAATGKVSLEKLREEIKAKRNKDLLMSYGLAPFGEDREKDMMERYQFIQAYAKEAKQFGAQRRASESKAASIALVNLSVHAGFSDVTRLILKMEGHLSEEFSTYMKWEIVEDVEICLQVDEAGKSGILCRKGEKLLKSLPGRLGKNSYVLEVKEVHKKLKEQYMRARGLMEEAMESGAVFAASEVAELLRGPVVGAILRPLVFTTAGEPGSQGNMGFPMIPGEALPDGAGTGAEDRGLSLLSFDGSVCRLEADRELRIAHPLDLFRAKTWHSYQKYLFERGLRQPFKQIFRELYVKLSEELGLTASRMFAGNQIQPQRTVGCLRGRRWIADYEEGLQKIYYKENVIARIYALADWFSPSDAEAPTLEWVEFSDRKTFRALTIREVPDLIYSEVMRDVDLAVSVAHAGGVDPETSHSTIEMRRAIVEFSLPLFKLDNVTLKESHALIRGTRGNYSVHLGSGVVHLEGGAMLNILPVHSQKRGKLFLPFVDEDPKTAEILSKIVLLAEDKKIKDPAILDQIRAGIYYK